MKFLLSLLALATLGTAAYQGGPIALSPAASLSWDVDFAKSEISFALVVSDAALKNGTADAWVGIGVGESTSGGMLGADIFTAEFSPGILDNCTVKDRHVPFVAYPLTEAPGAYPVEDSCQVEGSWTIIACVRNPENGTITLDVKRPLKAVSSQDRAIQAGEQVMMYAYGGSEFTYHGRNRGGKRVVLYNADNTLPLAEKPPLPVDVAANFSVTATNFTVPAGTTYTCTAAQIPVPAGQKWYMVAAQPILKAAKGPNMAHHFVVYLCHDRPLVRRFFETRLCNEFEGDTPKAGCSIIYAWAVGASRLTLPEDVGFLIDSSNAMVVIETHYDNPTGAVSPGVDTSGTEFFFSTDRKIQAGSMLLGDFAVSLDGQTVKSDFNYTSTCPSNCTAKWPDEEISVFASGLHMHTTGRNMWTNRYDSNGTFVETMNSIEYWSNDHQNGRTFDPPKKIRRGDILSTSCNFDTSKKPATIFGSETKDEMCVEFLFYYPVQKFGNSPSNSATINCGGFFVRQLNYTASFCGAADDPASFNFERNPSFDDTAGLPASFGAAPARCAIAGTGAGTNPINENGNGNGNATAETGEEEAQPTPSPEEDGGSVCFPGSAMVHTSTRGAIAMSELRIGDEVSVGDGAYSPVFMFTHKVPQGEFEFLQLTTTSGESLRLTAGHHLYANGKLVPARDVLVGDVLGGKQVVEKIAHVMDIGLYNPQTMHGDIVVNGVVTSTYTESIPPSVAHAMLLPLRVARSWLEWSTDFLEKDNLDLLRYARSCLRR